MSERAPLSALPLFGTAEVEKGRQVVAAVASLPERREYLEAVRSRMRMLYRARIGIHGEGKARVTPDDARRVFEGMNPPPLLNRSFLAAVFREPGWQVCGTYKSATKGSHGNELKAYRWVEPASGVVAERMTAPDGDSGPGGESW